MQKVLRMHQFQCVEERHHDPVEVFLGGWSPEPREPHLKALPPLKFHHHVGGGVCLEHADDAYDAWVPETREHARFLQKAKSPPLECLLVALRLGAYAHGGIA